MLARLMGLNTISPDALHRRLQNREPIAVIDVNAPASWERAHVPGASNLDPADFGAAELPGDKNAPLVFYCSNAMCRKAPSAARRARKMGFGEVLVMSAGIGGWLAASLPTEAGE